MFSNCAALVPAVTVTIAARLGLVQQTKEEWDSQVKRALRRMCKSPPGTSLVKDRDPFLPKNVLLIDIFALAGQLFDAREPVASF